MKKMKSQYINLKTYEELNEGAMGGSADMQPDKTIFMELDQPYVLSKELFKTGSSEVNKKSQQFVLAKQYLSNIPSGDTVLVTGYASLAGVGKGGWTEDKNKELAKKRAENFVKALKEEGVTQVKYAVNYIQSTDSKTSKSGSKEAMEAQSVTLTRYKKGVSIGTVIARDNTATVKPKILVPTLDKAKTEYFVLKFTYDSEERSKDPKFYSKVSAKLTEVAKSNKCTVTDITKWYSEHK